MINLHAITPAVAATFKAVRLRALLDAPTAFGSTHAKEVQLSEIDWQRRAAQWNNEQSVGFMAMDGHDACGLAGGYLDHDDPAIARLISMWVAATHRKRGVGRLLVNAVLDWARSKDVKTVCLMVTSNNETAMHFYDRLGFVRTGKTMPYPNDPELVEYEMAVRLE